MKLTTKFMVPKSPKGKDISTITMHKNISSRHHKFVPVVIERYKKSHVSALQEKLKLKVSSDMTVSQLLSIVRRKMKVNPSQGYHLLYSKGKRGVLMSQQLGRIASEYKSPTGVLCFTLTAQNTFGCPVPCAKNIKSKFPGIEPNPFGAPEPSLWLEEAFFIAQEEEQYAAQHQQQDDLNAIFLQYVMSVLPNQPLTPAPIVVPQQTHTVMPLTITHAENGTLSISSSITTLPMEVSSQQGSSPLPLGLLIHAVNHLVPLWQIHFLPPILTPGETYTPSEFVPLISALNRLILALQSHVPSEVHINATHNLHVPPHPLLHHFVSSFLADAITHSEAVSPEVDVQGILAAQTAHTSSALDLATQVLAGLQDPANIPLAAADSGTIQLDILAQYFNQAAQFLEFQTAGTPTANPHPFHNIPLIFNLGEDFNNSEHHPMPEVDWPPQNTLLHAASSLFLTDSDSFSEEEGDLEYFCDNLH